MKSITPDDLEGVFAVPPLARKAIATREIDFHENDSIVKHIIAGGITRLIYGGNAFLYHITLKDFESLLEWLKNLSDELLVIPGIGPSYGCAMDQAAILRKYEFPVVMLLPCGDARDATGLERGYREIADTANAKLIIYLKDENNFGVDRNRGLDAVARLVDDGICAGIKYAVVRKTADSDSYLDALLARVGRRFVISGIGERPAVIHMERWGLPGFTTGSGCIAPSLSRRLFEACKQEDFETASNLRAMFLAHEDMRDVWGPAKVLHHSIELAGIAKTGAIVPYVSALSKEELQKLEPVVRALLCSEVSPQEMRLK